MRRLIGGLVIGVLALLLGAAVPAVQAADSCSLNGMYAVDGLGDAGGSFELVGMVTFTPNLGCTDGAVGGSITIRYQGQSPISFTPTGTYSVSSAGAVVLTLPGVSDLVGFVALEAGGSTTANSFHLMAALPPIDIFRLTGTRTPLVVGQQDLTCPPDAVRSGPTCMDTYEASVWEIAPGNAAVIAKIKNGTVTLAELNTAGFQRGISSDDYGPGCPGTGNGCRNFYAVSIAGVSPSRFMTWFQAAAAARNAGKRLPTNAEWQTAALGTPDPGNSPGPGDCNTNSAGPTMTGAQANCVSDVGAFDMVGNLLEWVADWQQGATSAPGWGPFSDDLMGLAGAETNSGPSALTRGGAYTSGTDAGVFAVGAFDAPQVPFQNVGFRAAR